MAQAVISSRGAKILAALVLVAGLVAAFVVTQRVEATHQPADKVVASGSTIERFGDVRPLLTASLRTSKTADLILQVALECSIITELTTGGMGAEDFSEASGSVHIWVTIDGNVVPINGTSEQSQSPGEWGNMRTDSVTFCNRVYGRSVEDTEEDGDVDIEDDYIRTKNANAFNWLRLNLGNGVHEIKVMGRFVTSTQGRAVADAFVGKRTLVVEPAKLANDASV